MNDELIDDKLTPAARDGLNELVDEFRNQLLEQAASQATTGAGEIREISLRDLISSYETLRPQLSRKDGMRSKLSATVIQAIGLLIITGAAILLSLRGVLLPDLNLGLITATILIGLVIVLSGFTTLYTLRNSPRIWSSEFQRRTVRNSADLNYQVLRQWREIELALKRVASDKHGESAAEGPLSPIIRLLASDGIISDDDSLAILGYLDVRNTLAHQRVELSMDRYSVLVDTGQRLLRKLSKYSDPSAFNRNQS